jgi:hypothetical protein
MVLNRQDDKQFGTNIHIVQEPINNWLQGCIGVGYHDMMNNIKPIAEQAIARWGNKFSIVLFSDFE